MPAQLSSVPPVEPQGLDRALLLQPFAPSCYEFDERERVYIGGKYIEQRLDQVTGGDWGVGDLQVGSFELPDRTGILVTLTLSLAGGTPKPGAGQTECRATDDRGDQVKGAITAAIRNAANRSGVGRELWPALAGEHWRHWLGLLTTAEQVQSARELLNATLAWLKGGRASEAHRAAWRACVDSVRAALHAAAERTGPTAAPILSCVDEPRQLKQRLFHANDRFVAELLAALPETPERPSLERGLRCAVLTLAVERAAEALGLSVTSVAAAQLAPHERLPAQALGLARRAYNPDYDGRLIDLRAVPLPELRRLTEVVAPPARRKEA